MTWFLILLRRPVLNYALFGLSSTHCTKIPARHLISKGSQQPPTIEVSRLSFTRQRADSASTEARAMLHPEVDWTKIIQRTGDQHWWFSQLLDLSYLIRFLNPSPKRGQIVEYPNRLVRRLTAKFQAILKIADSVASGNNTSRPQLNSLITSPELVASQRSRWIVNATGKWNRNSAPRLCL